MQEEGGLQSRRDWTHPAESFHHVGWESTVCVCACIDCLSDVLSFVRIARRRSRLDRNVAYDEALCSLKTAQAELPRLVYIPVSQSSDREIRLFGNSD